LTAPSNPSSADAPRARRPGRAAALSPVLALAAALPIVFLHIEYQPAFVVDVGPSVTVTLADLAILAVAALAAVAAVRTRLRPLRAGLPIWIAAAAFLLFGVVRSRTGTHLVSSLKFTEYAALALAVPLLVRGRAQLRLLLWVVTGWAAIASTVGLAQFFGAGIAGGWGAGSRQPSFLGQLDFAALSGLAVSIGLAGLALGTAAVGGRRLVALATVAGALGLVLSASVAALAGFAAATAAIAVVALRHRRLLLRPRAAAVGAVAVALVVAGTLALRGGDLVQFTRFLGLGETTASATASRDVQTYGQRTVLVSIGWEIFKDHAAVGAGWNASLDPATFEPYLPAARRRFPAAAPLSFPSREHPWGVQNAYVQALADLGGVGLGLLVALLGAGIWVAARAALRGTVVLAGTLALSWLLVTMGVWAALGLVAGVPADAALWLALGLAAAAARLEGAYER
jgi:hypothetical protein